MFIDNLDFQTEKDARESPSPQNESPLPDEDRIDSEEIEEEEEECEDDDVKIEPKPESNPDHLNDTTNPFLFHNSHDILAAISSGMRLPAPPPGAITATPHRPSPFVPTSMGGFAAPPLGSPAAAAAAAAVAAAGGAGPPGGINAPGGNSAAMAAAAAADYASWLCRPLGLPGATAAAAAAAQGYLPLQANLLAARLNISKYILIVTRSF